MCLLAILYRVADDAPLIVAANREEAYTRQGTPLQLVRDPIPFLAGLDPLANGTWLGVNAHGLLVGITHLPRLTPSPKPRSRGLLVRDLLQCTTAQQASEAAVAELSKPDLYEGCNLLIGDGQGLYVVQAGEWLQVHTLPPGAHVLTSRAQVNDSSRPRIHFAQSWLAEQQESVNTSEGWLRRLPKLCSFTGDQSTPAICIHGPEHGTLCSSLIALRSPLKNSLLWHAQGPPDKNPYQDCSHLFADLC